MVYFGEVGLTVPRSYLARQAIVKDSHVCALHASTHCERSEKHFIPRTLADFPSPEAHRCHHHTKY